MIKSSTKVLTLYDLCINKLVALSKIIQLKDDKVYYKRVRTLFETYSSKIFREVFTDYYKEGERGNVTG
jgi:hypothetical protein